MKTSDLTPPGSNALDRVRGRKGKRAGTPGPRIMDAQGNDVVSPDVQFIGAQVSGEDGELAIVTINGSGSQVVNDAGADLQYGDVVVQQADGSVTTTTTAQSTGRVGVVQIGGADGDPVSVVFQGDVAQINTTASVTAGNYAETSTVAGQATENATPRSGSFGKFLGTGTNPSATLFGQTYLSGGGSGGGGGVPSWFNVLDYGAVGDDTTDDTAAIQAAIDAAEAAGGGVVYCPHPLAKYMISAALTVVSTSLKFLGDGGDNGHAGVAGSPGGTIIRQATTNTSAFSLTYPAHPCFFEGLWIEGPGGNSSGEGISVTAGDFNTFDVVVSGFYTGIDHPQNAFYSKHHNLRVFDCDGVGVSMHGGDTNNIDLFGVRISGCPVGVDVGGSLGVTIVGGAIEFNDIGVRANGGGSNGAGLTITGVYFEHDDGKTDILIGNSSVMYAVTLLGDTFVKSGYSGTGWHVDGQNVNGLTMVGCELMSSDAVRAVGSSTNVVLLNNRNRNAGTLTLPAGSINVDTTSTTPSADGTNAAGTSSKVARADHTHALGGAAGGDLSGTYPNPSVVDDSHNHTGATVTGVGSTYLVISSGHSTPLVFDDIVQSSDGDDFIYTS